MQQGHQILLRFRTRLAKRYPYVDRRDPLVVHRDESQDTLSYVRGRGWHAHWSLECSRDLTPHYHVMVAMFGYDSGQFGSALEASWHLASASVLGLSTAQRTRDVDIGSKLGAQTLQYMTRPKARDGRDVADFTAVLGEGQPLGSNWWRPIGRPCLSLVRGSREYLDDESLSVLHDRALRLHDVEWNGRAVPDRYAHYVHARTGRPVYLVTGPWLGAAAQYLSTGDERYLEEYRQVRRRAGARRRAEEAERFAIEFGL